ncbi:Hint domain-containing protein [Jhaorihella thermophila]|uniref:Hint domain-containing protein n=1 Tax=Jhaorihella thermophila TaxID=488547 RepID=A0A1H5VBT5_9RHOB|nr:Hint domain-containing protein [Jhaorihella thermophila]SEF83927.1 Hint domain-containing protein [Jhaorihella thermophila]
MSWIALAEHDGRRLSRRAFAHRAPGSELRRGSLVIETRLPTGDRPEPMIYFDGKGPPRCHLSVQSVPGGGLTFVMAQGQETLHRTFNHADTGRADLLRLTCSWDVDAGLGRVALECEQDKVMIAPLAVTVPPRLADLRVLFADRSASYLAPEVSFIALSDAVEPVGPMPTLAPDTPIATPEGFRAAGALRRGDTVVTAGGEIAPVLHRLDRTVPAMGRFRPIRLRAPYFGLMRDIVIAPSQRLVVRGSEVEYLFNHEAAMIEAGHLAGGKAVRPVQTGPLVTYTQLLLPAHEALDAGGAAVESLYVGRLRRKRDALEASILAGLDRQTLPEHGKSVHPVLRAFDARILAEQRAA